VKIIRGLYLNNMLFYLLCGVVALFVYGFFYPVILSVAKPALMGVGLLVVIDILILFANKEGVDARRSTMDKLSNGDDNPVQIFVRSTYQFPLKIQVIEELPFQFQKRDMQFNLTLFNTDWMELEYVLRPTKRGEYAFGALNVLASSPLRLVSRRYRFSEDQTVPVYPSFIQMRKYELLAISNRLVEAGVKKIRRNGSNNEFEQIKEYVQGDDFRTINWKATARKGGLMVNQYQDERSQQVYSVIDMGRLMQMPFNGLSLLDYSINSSLVISNIAMHKGDRAGVITFSHSVHSVVKASRRGTHLSRIMELLYNQKTGYLETDYQRLYVRLRREVTHRSLLMVYTNFESLAGLRRQLSYFRRMAKDHVLVVIFFENTELSQVLEKDAANTEEVYTKVIAEKFAFEKRQIVRELKKYGIHAILTPPEDSNVNTINKYLELKARGVI
jgi:uncharacterized protein (DUF58 family)